MQKKKNLHSWSWISLREACFTSPLFGTWVWFNNLTLCVLLLGHLLLLFPFPFLWTGRNPLETVKLGLHSHLCPLLAVRLRPGYINVLGLSFPICKNGSAHSEIWRGYRIKWGKSVLSNLPFPALGQALLSQLEPARLAGEALCAVSPFTCLTGAVAGVTPVAVFISVVALGAVLHTGCVCQGRKSLSWYQVWHTSPKPPLYAPHCVPRWEWGAQWMRQCPCGLMEILESYDEYPRNRINHHTIRSWQKTEVTVDWPCWVGWKPACENELEDVWGLPGEGAHVRLGLSQGSIEESRKCDDIFPQFPLSVSSLECVPSNTYQISPSVLLCCSTHYGSWNLKWNKIKTSLP